jgi:hypothetical protein
MLSKDDKQRVREEEIFRQEVRQELEKAKGKNSSPARRVFNFLNTGLGLWFLTTVAVGLVSFSYTKWDEHSTKVRDNRTAARKMNIEISTRLQDFSAKLDVQYAKYQKDKPADRSLDATLLGDFVIKYITTAEDPEWAVRQATAYPEYKALSVLTLMRNLADIDSNYKTRADNAIPALESVSKYAANYKDRWWPDDRRWETKEDAQVGQLVELAHRALDHPDVRRWIA